MLNGLDPRLPRVVLADLGAVRVQGADRVRFLQGQLSNDVEPLGAGQGLLAGFHNPQGRTIALLRLLPVGPDEVIAVLPRELAAPVAQRLARYVLRAKVKVTDASAEWQFFGITAEPTGDAGIAEALAQLPSRVNATSVSEMCSIVCISESPARWIAAVRLSSGQQPGTADTANTNRSREQWRALDIAAGLPQVYGTTSEAFVAQMLNLDLIGAISFTKGCYTGQEVIARAHYRGRVKRRMQRFRTASPAQLAVGDSGTFQDGRAFRVVEAVRLEDGRCEFLAVAPFLAGEPDAEAASSATTLAVEPLPLPYDLPE